MGPGDAKDIRTRLRRALPPAMKARDQTTVAALRSALAAIDNAEAVEVTSPPRSASPPEQAPPAGKGEGPRATGQPSPVPGESLGAGVVPVGGGSPVAGAVLGLGAGEVERRRLTAAEMASIVRREVTDRRSAARAYEDTGQAGRAERLRAEAEVLASYLADPDTST